jgi:hypothetical protein
MALATANVLRFAKRRSLPVKTCRKRHLDCQTALQDLGGAEAYLEYVNDAMANRAQALSAFIQSPSFVKSAPDSDLLATI